MNRSRSIAVASAVLAGVVVLTAGCGSALSGRAAAATGSPAASTSAADPAVWPAPTQVAPPDGAVFGSYPRTTTVSWQQVAGAVGYRVEVDYSYDNGSQWWLEERWEVGTPATEYTFDFVGAQPGRWRVQAVFSSGHAIPAGSSGEYGAYSPWREFTYTQ